MSKYYITTAIDYVNSKPHIGHAVEKVQADVLARYHRAKGDETYFLSGTDENSLKNVQAAEKEKLPIKEFVDRNAGYFKGLKELLGLSYDQFIRTTEKKHFLGVEKLWQAFKKEDIYKKNYKGLYCVGCEEFKMEKELVDGCCPEHKTKPEIVEEENYFFKLSSYQDKLKQLIESDTLKISPEFRKNEITNFIDSGLEDFSISRSVKRAKGWGVPVPSDPEQIMYVWVDALSNYITALDYGSDGELYHKFWSEGGGRVHVIGKGILRFHTVYWPAMLLSAGLPLPTKVLSHEYLTIDNQKISKSLGNVISPEEIVARYGVDASRYLLLTSLPWGRDGDISWKKMDERYASDLSNNLGNLLQRTISMVNKYDLQTVISTHPSVILSETKDLPGATLGDSSAKPQNDKSNIDVDELVEKLDHFGALNKIMDEANRANQLIAEKEPWTLAKEGKTEELTKVLTTAIGSLQAVADALIPFMPETAEKMKNQLDTLKPEPLFPRLENKE